MNRTPYTQSEAYRLKKMAALLGDNKQSVIDVGCADYPNPYLKAKQLIGIDLVNKPLPNNYDSFFCGYLAEFINKNSQQDAIVAGELIEHLTDPISFLQDCYNALKPNGVIILSTPNPHSPIESILNALLNKKYFYTEDHIMLFPQRWLVRMLTISGFNNIKLYSGGFPLPFLGLVPFPRPWCYQTIVYAKKSY